MFQRFLSRSPSGFNGSLPFTLPQAEQPPDFHFCRLFPDDDLPMSLARHEHYLCSQLRLKPAMKVLQVGCGTGHVAVELIRFSNVEVVGVDVDESKVKSAIARAEKLRLTDRLTFIHVSDYSDLSSVLSEKSFDVVYAIESLRNAPDFASIYRELYFALRPGGKLGVFEWCWASSFDVNDPDHCRLAMLLQSTTGISPREPMARSISAASEGLKAAGMNVLFCEDLGERHDRIPWYSPLERALSNSRTPWQSLEDCDVFGGLSQTAASVILEAAKLNLFTPMALFIAEKPKN
ncbi:unnamed protein product [Somion occarium]|uniref:Methyltransferase domain-containing protein n=1 Tax=Somion occarium TaxID=3059160 RepID=A0ABP1DFP0_9APHY